MRIAARKKYNDKLALQVFTKITAAADTTTPLGTVLTTKEKIMIGRRLIIAQAILKGVTRRELQDDFNISPNTFAQVNRWLRNELPEYDSFVASSKLDTLKSSTNHEPILPFSYSHLKRSYPGHFLLFSIAEAVWKKSQKNNS